MPKPPEHKKTTQLPIRTAILTATGLLGWGMLMQFHTNDIHNFAQWVVVVFLIWTTWFAFKQHNTRCTDTLKKPPFLSNLIRGWLRLHTLAALWLLLMVGLFPFVLKHVNTVEGAVESWILPISLILFSLQSLKPFFHSTDLNAACHITWLHLFVSKLESDKHKILVCENTHTRLFPGAIGVSTTKPTKLTTQKTRICNNTCVRIEKIW